MEKTADVVIIGGGIIGLSIAYYLALKKAGRIVLFEKGPIGRRLHEPLCGRHSNPIFYRDEYPFLPRIIKDFRGVQTGIRSRLRNLEESDIFFWRPRSGRRRPSRKI